MCVYVVNAVEFFKDSLITKTVLSLQGSDKKRCVFIHFNYKATHVIYLLVHNILLFLLKGADY